MRYRITAWLLLLALLLVNMLPACAQEQALLQDRFLSLSRNTAGARYFTDAAGNAVRLFGPDIRQADIEAGRIATLAEQWRAQGANAVRLGIDITATGEDKMELCGGYTEQGIDAFIDRYLDPDVQAILGNGMYVVLTLCESPSKKVGTALQHAYEKYLTLWTHIVSKYKDEPLIAAFDLWDEPQFALEEDAAGRARLASYFIDCIDTLRLYDERHVMIVSDWNGGYGTALPSQWEGESAAQLDAAHRNTAFSAHIEADFLGLAYSYYGSWWNVTAAENNLCLFFGRVQVPQEGLNEAQQQNLLQLAEQANASVFFACNGTVTPLTVFSQGAADKVEQLGDLRLVFEAEQHAVQGLAQTAEVDGAFGGQALYLKAPQKGSCVVLETGKVFPNGLYEVRVRYTGSAQNSAPVYVGYTTPQGKVVSLGALVYHQEGFTEQSMTIHIEGKFVDLVLWSDAAHQQNSVLIDRVILRSEGEVLPADATEGNVTAVRDGDAATTTTAPAAPPKGPTPWWVIASAVAGGLILLTVLVIGWLLFLGRHYDQTQPQQAAEEPNDE